MKNKYLLSFFTVFLSLVSNAQAPSNDNPETATTLTVGEAFSDNSIQGTNVSATNSSIADPSCASYNGGDLWYSFTVGASGNITVEIVEDTGSDIDDTGLSIYSGPISNLVEVACNDDNDKGTFSTVKLSGQTPGTILFARVWSFSNSSAGTFLISAFSPPPPPPAPNDEPETAVALTIGTTFDENKIVSTNLGATDSAVANTSIPLPECSNYAGGDIWFSLTIGAANSLIIETNGIEGFEPDFAVYSGAINSLVQVNCAQSSNQIGITERTEGEILYIRAFDFENDDTGNFEISAYAPPTPVNDDPEQATLLTPGETFELAKVPTTNLGATDSGASSSISSPECIFYDGGDIWFTTTVGANSSVIIQTNQSNLAAVLYSGTPSTSLVQEDCMIFRSPFIFKDRTEGETLYVRIFDIGNNNFNNFEIAALSALLPENGEPETATNLSVGTNFESNSRVASSLGASDSSIENPRCGAYFGGDIWYTAKVRANGSLTIETRIINSTDFKNISIAVYSGTLGSLSLIECKANDFDPRSLPDTSSKIELSNRTEGEVLYIRAWVGFNENPRQFRISAYDGDDTTLSNNDYELNSRNIVAYPSPFENELYISIKDQRSIESVEIYNLKGQQVVVAKDIVPGRKINTSSLTTGVYLVKYSINGIYKTLKITKH